MRQTDWTPGPWQMGNPGIYGTFNPPQIFAGEGDSRTAVASVYGIPLHCTLEEIDEERYARGLANARLIAKAPEMYELLRAYANGDYHDAAAGLMAAFDEAVERLLNELGPR